MHSLSRIQSAIKRLGMVDALLYVCAVSLRRVSGRRARLISYILVAQPVAKSDRLATGRGKSIEVTQLDPDNIRKLTQPRPAEIIEFRLRQGAVCFGAFSNSTMVGFIWLVRPAYDEDEVRCRFEPVPADRCAWDFDVFVDPAHRIGPAFMRLWDAANRWLRDQGVDWTMSRISSFNAVSVHSHRRLGAHLVGRAVFVRMGRLQLMISSLRPFIHASSVPTRVPVLQVPAPQEPTD